MSIMNYCEWVFYYFRGEEDTFNGREIDQPEAES